VRKWLAILVTLVACDDHGVASLSRIKARVCACTTASCAQDEMKLVSRETIDSTHRTQAIARDMLECRARLEEGERPSTDPDAEHSGSADPAAPGAPAGSGSAAEPPAPAPPGTPPR
jgi:hypothetical protein